MARLTSASSSSVLATSKSSPSGTLLIDPLTCSSNWPRSEQGEIAALHRASCQGLLTACEAHSPGLASYVQARDGQVGGTTNGEVQLRREADLNPAGRFIRIVSVSLHDVQLQGVPSRPIVADGAAKVPFVEPPTKHGCLPVFLFAGQ
jgi:hypothetical protein